ncbi:MAG: VOC family protein [Nannocystis sp.]|nr:VOC family protein [Nannocystis sp.]MBA3549985.1 VOC family protein [Nannocystis sp.]
MNGMPGMNGMHHLALRVADPELSARFYGELLGLPELARHHEDDGRVRAVWLKLGGSVLMLERKLLPAGAHEGSAHVLVLAADPDDGDALATWAQRLAAANVTVVERTGFTLYFHDPDGHRLGVSTFVFAGL